VPHRTEVRSFVGLHRRRARVYRHRTKGAASLHGRATQRRGVQPHIADQPWDPTYAYRVTDKVYCKNKGSTTLREPNRVRPLRTQIQTDTYGSNINNSQVILKPTCFLQVGYLTTPSSTNFRNNCYIQVTAGIVPCVSGPLEITATNIGNKWIQLSKRAVIAEIYPISSDIIIEEAETIRDHLKGKRCE